MSITLSHPVVWRSALVVGGLLGAVGGPQHPDSDGSDPLTTELATMTADESWVPAHTLIMLGTFLIALGLWGAWRSGAWSRAGAVVRLAAIAMSVYVVETVMHLASVVDQERLAAGEVAPVAYSHLGLALVLYPVSGIALSWLALSLARHVWTGPAVALAVPGVLAGIFHAVSVPLTLALPEAELTPVFAAAGMLTSLWAISAGLVGARRRTPVEPVRVAATTATR